MKEISASQSDSCAPPPTAFTVLIFMQGAPFEVNTVAEVTVLGTEVYNRIREKPLSVGR